MEWLFTLIVIGTIGGFAAMMIRFALQELRKLRRDR